MEQQKRPWLSQTYSGEKKRCDVWLSEVTGARRSFVQSWFINSGVTVNGKSIKPSLKLQDGDHLIIYEEPLEVQKPLHLEPIPMDLDILYEDTDLIVVNKPAHLSVHPGAGLPVPTLLHGLLAHGLQGGDDDSRPGIVHRLDKDTTGALVAAKNGDTHAGLSAQFAAKTNQREYWALLDGMLPQSPLLVENHLHRDPNHRLKFCISDDEAKGKWSSSRFETLSIYAHIFTLAKVTLQTGRTHQIRVHSQSLKAPIIGDPLYGKARQWPQALPLELRTQLQTGRQMLHARTLGFIHPRTQEHMIFEASLPQDFEDLLSALKPFQLLTE